MPLIKSVNSSDFKVTASCCMNKVQWIEQLWLAGRVSQLSHPIQCSGESWGLAGVISHPPQTQPRAATLPLLNWPAKTGTRYPTSQTLVIVNDVKWGAWGECWPRTQINPARASSDPSTQRTPGGAGALSGCPLCPSPRSPRWSHPPAPPHPPPPSQSRSVDNTR